MSAVTARCPLMIWFTVKRDTRSASANSCWVIQPPPSRRTLVRKNSPGERGGKSRLSAIFLMPKPDLDWTPWRQPLEHHPPPLAETDPPQPCAVRGQVVAEHQG